MKYWRERFRVSMVLLEHYKGSEAFLGEISPPKKFKLIPGGRTVREVK